MKLYDLRLDVTTDSSGDGTDSAETAIFGQLYAVEWIDGTFDNGVDGTLTCIRTASGVDRTLLTLTDANDDAVYYPRYLVHSEAGAALTGTSGGDRALGIINGILKLTVAQGGNAKTGGCVVYYLA